MIGPAAQAIGSPAWLSPDICEVGQKPGTALLSLTAGEGEKSGLGFSKQPTGQGTALPCAQPRLEPGPHYIEGSTGIMVSCILSK